MVLGERNITLYGKGYIVDTLCGHTFAISPSAFYQVNPVQTEILYQTAMDYAGLTGKETVVDAYCGIGTIGIIAADKAKSVIGVELNPASVKDARNNARHNNIGNITFYQNDAERFLNEMQEQNAKADVIFMDPPRAGSTQSFMASAISLNPDRIVYISCNPETLARDLEFFKKHQYTAEKIQPVDMFPFTTHMETVCLLVLRNPVTHINIDVDVEEMVQDKRGMATYGQIKEYVLEHSGLKVSSLYIAQVKQKHGIIERENYNKPKSENAKQPQCPPDKERAITEALKHFGML